MPQLVTSSVGLVHYLPIFTTFFAAVFFLQLLQHYVIHKSKVHVLWWTAGVFAFGLGTALESSITLFGNTVWLNKGWYIAGAILGAYPLAQGTVFLLLKRRDAIVLTLITLPLIFSPIVLVVLSPIHADALESHRPSGAILAWSWIRLMTLPVNLYAVTFLIGGAIFSAIRYSAQRESGDGSRAVGNTLIAVGAILPGIGGGMAKAGIVEALYVGELIGLILIWWGYRTCVGAPKGSTDSHKPGYKERLT